MVRKEQSKIFLVTELMDTDLSKVKSVLQYEEKLQVAKDIAKAMYEVEHRYILSGSICIPNILRYFTEI